VSKGVKDEESDHSSSGFKGGMKEDKENEKTKESETTDSKVSTGFVHFKGSTGFEKPSPGQKKEFETDANRQKEKVEEITGKRTKEEKKIPPPPKDEYISPAPGDKDITPPQETKDIPPSKEGYEEKRETPEKIDDDESLPFDGKRGHKEVSLPDNGEQKKVDDIITKRKEEIVEEISGEIDVETETQESEFQSLDYIHSEESERKDTATEEETPDPIEVDDVEDEDEESLPPPPTDFKEENTSEQVHIEEEEILSEELDRYKIRHQPPRVSGKPAEPIGIEEEEESPSEENEAQMSVDPRLIDELKSQVSKLSDKVDSFEDKLEDFSDEMTDLDEEVSLLATRVDKLEEREVEYEEVEEKLKELAALYDLLSSDISPFMDLEVMAERAKEAAKRSSNPSSIQEQNQSESMKSSNPDSNPSSAKSKDLGARSKPNDGGPRTEYIIDWVEFLHNKTSGNLQDALEYYKELGWIGEDLKDDILTYTKGMNLPVKEDEKSSESKDWRLKPQDHKESLKYIEAIKNNGGSKENESKRGRLFSSLSQPERGES